MGMFLLIIPVIWFWFSWYPISWGFLFLVIIAGIILALRYFFAPYAVIIEGISGRTALSRSKSLTKGRLLSMLLLEVGFGLLFLSVNGVPLGLLIFLIGLFFGKPFIGFSKPTPVWAETIGLFGIIIMVGMFEIFNVLLFKSLRAQEFHKKGLGEANVAPD